MTDDTPHTNHASSRADTPGGADRLLQTHPASSTTGRSTTGTSSVLCDPTLGVVGPGGPAGAVGVVLVLDPTATTSAVAAMRRFQRALMRVRQTPADIWLLWLPDQGRCLALTAGVDHEGSPTYVASVSVKVTGGGPPQPFAISYAPEMWWHLARVLQSRGRRERASRESLVALPACTVVRNERGMALVIAEPRAAGASAGARARGAGGTGGAGWALALDADTMVTAPKSLPVRGAAGAVSLESIIAMATPPGAAATPLQPLRVRRRTIQTAMSHAILAWRQLAQIWSPGLKSRPALSITGFGDTPAAKVTVAVVPEAEPQGPAPFRGSGPGEEPDATPRNAESRESRGSRESPLAVPDGAASVPVGTYMLAGEWLTSSDTRGAGEAPAPRPGLYRTIEAVWDARFAYAALGSNACYLPTYDTCSISVFYSLMDPGPLRRLLPVLAIRLPAPTPWIPWRPDAEILVSIAPIPRPR